MSHFPAITRVRLRCAAAVAAVVFSLGAFPKTAWSQCETEFLASDGAASDFLGYSVAVSGDVGLVGARLHEENGANSGSAYVFRFNDTGILVANLELKDIAGSKKIASRLEQISGNPCYQVSLDGGNFIAFAFKDKRPDINNGAVVEKIKALSERTKIPLRKYLGNFK